MSSPTQAAGVKAASLERRTEGAPEYPQFRWFVAAAVIVANIAIGLYLVAFAPIIGILASELGVTVGQATLLLLTSFVLTNAIGAMASGSLIDRIGVRACIIVGGAIVAVASLLLPFVGGVSLIVAMRALQGFGFGPASACVPALAARWFPPQERGLVTGGQGFGVALGIAISFVLVPVALQSSQGNWRPGMVWLGVVAVISLALCFLTLCGKEPKAPTSAAGVSSGSADFKFALRQSTFYIATVSLVAYGWIMSTFNTLTPAYLAVDRPLGLGLGPLVAGKLMMCVQIGMIIGSIASGVLAQKAFNGNVKPMIMLAFVFCGTFVISIGFPFVYRNSDIMAACLFLTGFFEAFLVVGVATFVALNYPHGIVGRVFALMFGMSMFGATAGGGIGGAVLHETNSFQLPVLLLGLVALIGLVVTAFLKPPAAFMKSA